MEQFTEQTLKDAGWYYFIPPPAPDDDCRDVKAWVHHGGRQAEGFLLLNQEDINDGNLKCPKYTGHYIGPYPVPTLTRQTAHAVDDQ